MAKEKGIGGGGFENVMKDLREIEAFEKIVWKGEFYLWKYPTILWQYLLGSRGGQFDTGVKAEFNIILSIRDALYPTSFNLLRNSREIRQKTRQ